jgi:rhodanese-related sulfurtransferase
MSGLLIEDITPRDLAARLGEEQRPLLLDVREAWELSIARIDPSMHMPMNDVPDRLDELNPDQEIVVLCHHGRRSRQVVAFLKQSGFRQVLNLVGGIDAWSTEVDQGVPVY